MAHMSAESWIFLFAALGGIGGLGTLAQLYFTVRQQRQHSMTTSATDQPMLEGVTNEKVVSRPEAGMLPISRTRLAVVSLLLLLSVCLSTGGFVSSIQRKEELQSHLKPENIQGTVRQWLDSFGFSSTVISDPAADFNLTVRTPLSGNPITVAREKAHDQYITVVGSVMVSPEHQALIAKLPENEKNRNTRNVFIELYRFGVDGSEVEPSKVTFFKRVPITNALTEDSLIKIIISVESIQNVIVQTILRDIGK
jgi:hypothetical protein